MLVGGIYFTPASGWGDKTATKHIVAHEVGHALGFTAPLDDVRILLCIIKHDPNAVRQALLASP